MTKLRNRPKFNYHTLIVCPDPGFSPKDWRDKPTHYTVVSYEGPEQFRGRADAWRFTFNQRMMKAGAPRRWAIVCKRLESLSPNQTTTTIPTLESRSLPARDLTVSLIQNV